VKTTIADCFCGFAISFAGAMTGASVSSVFNIPDLCGFMIGGIIGFFIWCLIEIYKRVFP
jgi:hypothetical protein